MGSERQPQRAGPAGDPGQRPQGRAPREVYRPEVVRCLLISTALPNRLDRFFYYADARRADYLFLGVMQALYPGLKGEFLAARRPSALKEHMLRRFQGDGFYLIDLPESPADGFFGVTPRAVAELVRRVEEVASRQTPIVLIKAAAFGAAYAPLRAAGYQRVHPRAIPFPSEGWQQRFCELFRQALAQGGVSWQVQ